MCFFIKSVLFPKFVLDFKETRFRFVVEKNLIVRLRRGICVREFMTGPFKVCFTLNYFAINLRKSKNLSTNSLRQPKNVRPKE